MPRGGKPPRRVPERHPSPPRKGQSPTPGTRLAGSVSAARVQPRGCKGRSPLHKKTLSLPLPAGKGGGGMGAESKLKAKSAGDNESTPPAGYPSGRDSQYRLGSVAGDARGEAPLPTTPLSKTPPVFHTVWKRLWTFPRLFHSLWKTMLKSTVCIAVCNPRRPRIRALQQKNTPPAVLWICIKNRTDKFPKPTASPTGCPQMPVDRTPGFPT